jgi:NAD(P)H-hydrate repair Nnr-like enzyme with NAD(P)H-hydrate epimerase domain
MACARLLHLRGFTDIQMVTLLDYTTQQQAAVAATDSLRPNIREQLDLFLHFVGERKMYAMDWDVIKNFKKGILVDGILGTGIADPPRGVAKEAIEAPLTTTTTTTANTCKPYRLIFLRGSIT